MYLSWVHCIVLSIFVAISLSLSLLFSRSSVVVVAAAGGGDVSSDSAATNLHLGQSPSMPFR